jgi:hypothetical protein
MKTWMKILITLIILGAIGAWAGYTFVYNKAHTDFEKAEAEHSLLAEDLFNAFRSDAEAAGAKYNGKVLEISGKLTSVEKADTLVIGVFAFEEGMFGAEGIRITMLENHAQKLLAHPKSKEITLKGFCPGYNGTDVIIESGSIVK